MIDPLSALGLTENIIQIISFGLKLLSTSRKVYGSLNGTTEEHVSLTTTTQDLENLCSHHLAQQQSYLRLQGAKTTAQEAAIEKLSVDCGEEAGALLKALQSVIVQGGNRKWQSFRAALRIKWSERRIKESEGRLRHYREEITLRLTSLIKQVLLFMGKVKANCYE